MKTARAMAPSSTKTSTAPSAWSSSNGNTENLLPSAPPQIMMMMANNNSMQQPTECISDAAMDAYAQRILEQHAARGTSSDDDAACLDESLGPYITSLLRNNIAGAASGNNLAASPLNDVTLLPDYDGLIELLQEHCGFIKAEQAQAALQEIATAVATGGRFLPPAAPNNGGVFPSMQVLQTALPIPPPQQPGAAVQPPPVLTVDEEEFPTLSQANAKARGSKAAPSASGATNNVMSPNRADSLIPLHLLDEDVGGIAADDIPGQSTDAAADDGNVASQEGAIVDSTPQTRSAPAVNESKPPRPEKDNAADQSDFPALGAAVTTPPKKTPAGRSSSKKCSSHKDPDLAASLFRPARSRQSSIDETVPSNNTGSSATAPNGTTAAAAAGGAASAASSSSYQPPRPDPYIDPQHYESVVGMLLSMNGEMLSPDAAYTAALMAPAADLGTAQYLIEAAMTAPPICRHLLQSGCYRSDCTYSHDLEGHTCIFWLRGRCGKGDSCRFLHGFHPQLLQKLQEQQQQVASHDLYYAAQQQQQFSSPAISVVPPSSSYMVSPPTSAPVSQQATWGGMAPPSSTPAPSSFANIASQGYNGSSSFAPAATSSWSSNNNNVSSSVNGNNTTSSTTGSIPTTRIPQDLWNAHENRDASAFHIADPLERYRQVATTTTFHRSHSNAALSTGLIDLHFQSTKTFATVLDTVLPTEIERYEQVWIVTGTGHHVGTQTHQKGGGALESAVLDYLVHQGYNDDGYRVYRGRDANGHGGAILVRRPA